MFKKTVDLFRVPSSNSRFENEAKQPYISNKNEIRRYHILTVPYNPVFGNNVIYGVTHTEYVVNTVLTWHRITQSLTPSNFIVEYKNK